MVNFSSLNNLTTLTFNNSLINNSNNMTESIINNADTVTTGYFGLGVMLITFIVLMIILFKDDGDIRMDLIRSIMISSGFVSIIGVIALYNNIFSSFVHVMWFIIIFAITLISAIFLKKKGL